MVGRRRVGAHATPRHARRQPLRAAKGLALLVAGGIAALTAGVLLVGAPAGAEAGSTTATLTLTGVRDSNCPVSTGGTDVYVKPGGTVTFKPELAGLSVNVLGHYVDISSSAIASFNVKLVIDGHVTHPHYIAKGKTLVWRNVSAGTHSIAWSANSIKTALGLTIPLSLAVVHLPVGGELDWDGAVKATNNTKCGISVEVPGGGVTVGPIHVSVPPVHLPTVPLTGLPSVPSLPGGGGSSSHHPGGGSSSSPGSGGGTGVSGLPTSIPELVVPNAGSGGDSAFGGGALGGINALPGSGDLGPAPAGAVTSTAAAPGSPSSSRAKPVDLATDTTDTGIGGAQLPVLLAIVAIIALSLVTATYARMYLLRKPPAA